MRVFVENIDHDAHTADLRCGKQGCDYAAEGVDLLTHAQVKFAETIEGVTINGNIAGAVDSSNDLPDPTGLDVDTLYHAQVDEDSNLPDGGANLFRVVDNGGTKEWQQVNAAVAVSCPTCGMVSTYPAFDSRNICGTALFRAKTS